MASCGDHGRTPLPLPCFPNQASPGTKRPDLLPQGQGEIAQNSLRQATNKATVQRLLCETRRLCSSATQGCVFLG